MKTMSKLAVLLIAFLVLAGPGARTVSAQSARTLYTKALSREHTLRQANARPSLAALRKTIASYESVVRRYPGSAYCDNALWKGANLALVAYERFNEPEDQRTGLRLLTHLAKEYPTSSLRPQIAGLRDQLQASASVATSSKSSPPSAAGSLAKCRPGDAACCAIPGWNRDDP